MEKYVTTIITDGKGRVQIPAEVRRQMGCSNTEIKPVFKLTYDPMTNEVVLEPIGLTETK